MVSKGYKIIYMDSVNKNLIVFFLIVCIAGIFLFHWFFMEKTMLASGCFSPGCVYYSFQTTTHESKDVLLVILITVLLAVLLPYLFWPDNKLKRASQRFFLKDKIDVFCYKLIFWLKTLEKRDPRAALITARISDFRQ